MEVYAIKYIPFIVALVVCTVFGVLTRLVVDDPVSPSTLSSYYSELWVWSQAIRMYAVRTVCRYFARERLNFSGVWLIATLLMNPAFLTSFAVLRCPGVQRENGNWMNVGDTCIFALDGSIKDNGLYYYWHTHVDMRRCPS